MKNPAKFLCVLISGVSLACGGFSQAVTTRSLLSDLFDLERLTRFPAPAYVTRQASSFDRASKSPDDNWFANADAGQFVREESIDGRTEWVMADLSGPGAVVRIWSANPQGTIRFYFDGEERARYQADFEELTSGKLPLLPEPLSHRLAMGANLYFPFPYERSLKITVDDSDGAKPKTLYYHVNYRTYVAGTEVRSFAPEDLNDLPIARLRRMLFDPEQQIAQTAQSIGATFVIDPGRTFSFSLPDGSGAIQEMRVIARGNERAGEDTLRKVLIVGTFDGQKTIECPLGDFFGSAPGLSGYKTLPMGMDAELEEMRSYWVMPQRESGEFAFANHSSGTVHLRVEVRWRASVWTEDTMHFHAKWRRETMRTRPMRDWNILSVTGEGRFVGCALYVANPTRQWWGEGDEKIYIDGETFPSTFGTGTEDYFGYAWCCPETFSNPFHSQPRCDGPGNRGYTSNNRFHIIDDIPFRTSFRFDLEIWHWADVTADFATVAYWYAKPGSTDRFPTIRSEELFVYPIAVYGVPGAIEGEDLRLIEHKGGVVQRQGLDDRWSRDEQVWWRDGSPGDTASWEVKSEKTGTFRLRGRFTEATDYGIIQLYWNGEKLGEPIDFYSAQLGLRTIDFGDVTVRGANVLEARIVGANEDAVKKHMFGIDYLLVGD